MLYVVTLNAAKNPCILPEALNQLGDIHPAMFRRSQRAYSKSIPSLIAPRTDPYVRVYAYGSYHGSMAANTACRTPPVPWDMQFPLCVGSMWDRTMSPRPVPFPPQPPQKVSLPCSAAPQALRHSPTSPTRACPPFGLWPSRTGLASPEQGVFVDLPVLVHVVS